MPVKKILVMAYVICGLLWAAQQPSTSNGWGPSHSTVGIGLETQAYSSGMIGGVSLAGEARARSSVRLSVPYS